MESNHIFASIDEDNEKGKPVIVVAFQISRNDLRLKTYSDLSPKRKVQKLAQDITDVYDKVKKQYPHSNVIILWREYGIYEGRRPQNRYITKQDKEFLTSTFSNLCKDMKDLVIIAGTVAQRKPITSEKAKLIKDSYEQFKSLEDKDIS